MASITQGNAFSTEELNKMKANYQNLQQPKVETPKIEAVVPTGVINAPVQTVAPTTPKTNTFVSNMSNISKADPNAIANSGYINALYQEKFRRDATQAELDKFTTNTVKDASNLILGQDMSPFRDVPNTDIGNTPTQIDPNAGADNLVDGLVKDDVVVDEEAQKIGYQAEIDKINAENQKALAEKQAIIDEKKAIEEARLEADRANLEAGIEKRDLTQDEINTDKELIEKENYFDSLSTINESISNAITDKAAFEAKMKAERGDNYRSIPSVKRVLDNYDEMIASSQILKNNLTTGFNNASIAVDNYYSSKMATIDSNEATYKTLYDLDNANVISLSKEEKANLDAQNAIAEEEKVKLQEKQGVIDNALQDSDVYKRALIDYGLNLDDEPEVMLRKINSATTDQAIANSLIASYPTLSLTTGMSLKKIREIINNSTGDDLETITQDKKIYSFNKTTGELKLLNGDEDDKKFEYVIDEETGNLVKKYKVDETYVQALDSVESALENFRGMNFSTGTDPFSQFTLFNVTGEKDAKQNFLGDAEFIISNLKLSKLQEAKANGASFGAMSKDEWEILGAAATKLEGYAKRDKDGKLIGFDASTQSVYDEFSRVKEYLEKMRGPEQEIVTKSNKQLVSDYYINNPEFQSVITAMSKDMGYDEMAEYFGLTESENGGGDIMTYDTGAKAGQCGVYINKVADIRVGNNKQDKINNVNKYGTKGTDNIQVGDVIVQNIGTYGHVAVVTKINSDGTVTLSESNYNLDEKVTNDRKISLNNSSIYGYLRPSDQTSNTLKIV